MKLVRRTVLHIAELAMPYANSIEIATATIERLYLIPLEKRRMEKKKELHVYPVALS